MESIELARAQMAEEINIVEIIKSRRYFNMALRQLLTKKQRSMMKEKSRFIVINPKEDKQKVE